MCHNSLRSIDADFIESVWSDYLKRVERIKAAGGISEIDVIEGKDVPIGWQLDVACCYWIPPHFSLTEH